MALKRTDHLLGAVALGGVNSWLNKNQLADPNNPSSQFKPGMIGQIPSNAIVADLAAIAVEAFKPDIIPPQYRSAFEGAVDGAAAIATMYFADQQGLGSSRFPESSSDIVAVPSAPTNPAGARIGAFRPVAATASRYGDTGYAEV